MSLYGLKSFIITVYACGCHKKGYPDNFLFSYFSTKAWCVYLLEISWRSSSNEYLQHMFSLRNKKKKKKKYQRKFSPQEYVVGTR